MNFLYVRNQDSEAAVLASSLSSNRAATLPAAWVSGEREHPHSATVHTKIFGKGATAGPPPVIVLSLV
jgi:hypothetical protein